MTLTRQLRSAPADVSGPSSVRPGRGRRVSERKSERVQEIVARSVEVLITEGYAQFSLRKVSSGLGVRLATVQHYFPTREALLVQALGDIFSTWDARFERIAGSNTAGADERLFELQAASIEVQFNSDASALVLELFAFAQHDPIVRDQLDAAYGFHRLRIKRLLAEIRPDLDDARLTIETTVIAAHWEGLAFFTAPGITGRPEVESMLTVYRRNLRACLDAIP